MANSAFNDTTQFGMSMRFDVKVGGMDLGGWQSCAGLNVDFGLKELRSGGNNDYSLYFADQIKFQKITLKRAMNAKDSKAVLNWLKQFVEDDTIEGQTSTITLRDAHNETVCEWELRNTMPAKWTGPTLDATTKNVAIEVLELVHEGFL